MRFDNKEVGKGLFKFYNVIADHDQFEDLVRDNWVKYNSQNKLRDIWRKCQHLKGPLKQLNTKWFLRTTERVEGFRMQLQNIQHQLAQDITNADLIQ